MLNNLKSVRDYMGTKIKNIKVREEIPKNTVISIVNILQKEGYYVKTNITEGQNKISGRMFRKYGNYIPDIFAFRGINDIMVIEFETCASVSSPKNENKWKLLSSKPGLDFHIIVPFNCMEKARFKSRIRNIPVKIHCINNWEHIFEFKKN